jgi:hypothetical protein
MAHKSCQQRHCGLAAGSRHQNSPAWVEKGVGGLGGAGGTAAAGSLASAVTNHAVTIAPNITIQGGTFTDQQSIRDLAHKVSRRSWRPTGACASCRRSTRA